MRIKVKNVSGKIWYLFDSVMVSRNCLYVPTRAELRRLFLADAGDKIRVLNPQGGVSEFYFRPANRGKNRFNMGCQHFDAKNGAIVRRWALGLGV
jgi:hypothetical protein